MNALAQQRLLASNRIRWWEPLLWALAFAVPRLRGLRPRLDSPSRGVVEWLLLGAVGLYALQAAYSAEVRKAWLRG